MKLKDLKIDIDYFAFDKSLYQKLDATPLKNPTLISYNKKAFDLIDLDYEESKKDTFVDFINGSYTLEGSFPYSMVYAGHQFGYFVPQLGDGRAINLGSINNWHLQTKGSGLTRYSRQGDGRAVLRSSIREYIMSEAMNALDIPTTRALAIIGSESYALREYGNETCSVVMRMSPSWIRIGTFEFFAKTKNSKKNLIQLADYVIKQSYPHLENQENKYEKMFFELCDRSTLLLAKWQAYGFMHGVMNTDNFSMAGLTIDYGPFAFMDYFEKNCICNHTDTQGRYSFNNQPYVARWNLAILAYSLSEICDVNKLLEYLNTFIPQHEKQYLEIINQRLGLDSLKSSDDNLELISKLLESLEIAKMDYNLFFYELSKLKSFDEIKNIIDLSIYPQALKEWFELYEKACIFEKSSFENRIRIMKKVNPKFVIKNYMLQEAIQTAEEGDFSLVNDLLLIAQNPYDEHKLFEKYSKSTPIKYANIQLSCSS